MEDWREKLGAAFGISADDVAAEAESVASESATAVSAIEQQGKARVNILLDKKGRHGKQATLVTDLNVDDEALKDLARELKTLCGVGGSALEIQTISENLMRTRQITAQVIADHTGKTLDEVYAVTAHDSYFDAQEAVDFGLADRIIETL